MFGILVASRVLRNFLIWITLLRYIRIKKIVFIGISLDKDEERWKKTVEKKDLKDYNCMEKDGNLSSLITIP